MLFGQISVGHFASKPGLDVPNEGVSPAHIARGILEPMQQHLSLPEKSAAAAAEAHAREFRANMSIVLGALQVPIMGP
jgi:hypothetical protein